MTANLGLEDLLAGDQNKLTLEFSSGAVLGVDYLLLIDGQPVSADGSIAGEPAVTASTTNDKRLTELQLVGAFSAGKHDVTIEILASAADPHPEISLLGATLDGIALGGVTGNISSASSYSFDFGTGSTGTAALTTGLASQDTAVTTSADQSSSTLSATVSSSAATLAPQSQSSTSGLSENSTSGANVATGSGLVSSVSADTTSSLSTSASATTGTVLASVSTGADSAIAASSAKLTYVGVNEGMGPNAPQNDPGTYGTNWWYPTDAEMDYEKSQGMNIIRLGFLDYRAVTNAAGTQLSATTLDDLIPLVNYATSIGLKVILDDHDYGYYFGTELGLNTQASETATSEFATFWGTMAAEFKNNPNVIFGVMNEPNQQTAAQWEPVDQAAVNAIRAAGATTQEILVSGTNWDGAASWDSAGSDGSSNATELLKLTDPNNNTVFEVHSYPDKTSGGTGSATNTTTGVTRLEAVTAWANANHKTLFLGETGGTTGTTSMAAVGNELSYIQSNSNVWQGVTEWAAGPWWGTYQYSLEPLDSNNGAGVGLNATGITTYNQPQQTQLDAYGSGLVNADPPCYCRGTHILTDRGEITVEELRIGDRLITSSGTARPLRWIGTRAYDGRFVAQNRNLLPILIKPDALAEGVPSRELYVSPLHALFLEAALIPAQALVNGGSIVQMNEVETLEYFHLELETHDVIFAEYVAAESYLDDQNRGMFQNAGEYCALYPDAAPQPAEYCAPRLSGGEAVARLRLELARRSAALGYPPSGSMSVALAPGQNCVTFPPGLGELRLVSGRGTAPGDKRWLGALVTRIELDGASLDLTDSRLAQGFHAIETHGSVSVRWTDGEAVIALEPAPVVRHCTIEVAALADGPEQALAG